MPILDTTPFPSFQKPKKQIHNLTGQRFGRLRVFGLAGTLKRVVYWYCICDCKTLCWTSTAKLKTKQTTSCGCWQRESNGNIHRTHGMRSTRTYKSWADMIQRARNPNDPAAVNYSQRGIGVCDRWLKFKNFLADMGTCPDGLTIERKNNDLGYFPENCKWATYSEQARNKRTSRTFEFNGKKQSSAAWAREYGLNRSALKYRLDAGWSIERALTEPLEIHKRKPK